MDGHHEASASHMNGIGFEINGPEAAKSNPGSTVACQHNQSRRSRSRGRSRSRSRRRRSRSRSSSVDSLGRIKRPRVSTQERSAAADERSPSPNRGKIRSRATMQATEEEPELGTTLPAPQPSLVADTRETIKILSEAPKETIAPPPPRRRRREREGTGSESGRTSSPATKPLRIPIFCQENDFETEEERERREEAERRERRRELLAKISGPVVTSPFALSLSPKTDQLSPQPSMSPKCLLPNQATSSLDQAAPATADTGVEKQEMEDPKAKEARLRAQLLRKFMTDQRKRRESITGIPEDVTDEGSHSKGQAEQAVQSGVLKRGEEGAAASARNCDPVEKAKPAPPAKPFAGGGGFDLFATDGPEILAFKSTIKTAAGLQSLDDKVARGEQQDEEGYYRHRIGEKICGRYRILGIKGQGVFSSVLLAQDEKHRDRQVVVKVLRANELMVQAGHKEAEHLRELTRGESNRGQTACVKFIETFQIGDHVCLVMEAMNINLRKLLKTYGGSQGIAIKAVLSYTKQLMAALQHLHKHQIVHADLKPDNLVVDQKMSLLKICDFGSAMKLKELQEIGDVPYLQSRFYRAPEVILGYEPRGTAMDVWSAATSMYEMYTAQVLFPGRHNNEVLKSMMDVRGMISRKLVRKASLRAFHFDVDMRFLSRENDNVMKKEVVRPLTTITPTRNIGEMLHKAGGGAKLPQEVKIAVDLLRSVLDQCLVFDPVKRSTAAQAYMLFKAK